LENKEVGISVWVGWRWVGGYKAGALVDGRKGTEQASGLSGEHPGLGRANAWRPDECQTLWWGCRYPGRRPCPIKAGGAGPWSSHHGRANREVVAPQGWVG